jgi:trehalose 6-phosphate synthase
MAATFPHRPASRRPATPLFRGWRVTRGVGAWLKFAAVAVAAVAVLALVIAPSTRSLVEQWSRRDLESRSRLIYTAVQAAVARDVAEGSSDRLDSILASVGHDKRVVAVGLCDQDGRLRRATRTMPRSFSCKAAEQSGGENFTQMIRAGRRVLVGSFPIGVPGGTDYLIVMHDLSLIDARSDQAQALSVATVAGVAILVCGVGTLLFLLLMRGWMGALRQAVYDARAGRPVAAASRDPTFIDTQIQMLLRELDTGEAPTETAQVEWTPQSLLDLLRTALPGAEVIIVSNREPYIHNRGDDGQVVLQTPASGLVSALEPVMRACGGTWIAHGSGAADHEMVDAEDRLDVPPAEPAYKLRRVWLTDEEQDGYYYGLSNEGIWPLCHIAFVRPVFRESDWHAYERVNARFADAVAQEARTEDPIVLVQDYHFALAPKMIRERLPKATIITFWHIPWPNAETFGICPWKERIIEGLLGSTILGFHTQFHCNNFLETVDRFVESRIDRERATVTLGGEETLIRPYPISIEWPPKQLADQAPVEVCRARVRERLGLAPDAKLAVGIERFDYTKGILDRMHSVDAMLAHDEAWRGRFTFVQVAAPTRSKLPSYRRLQDEAVALAEEINARYGDETWQPVRLIIRHHEPSEVFELFRAADMCIVSSLHDGMNLVAKEFVASRDDEQGVLVLSSFTGASRELSEALIVNPYDAEQMAGAFDTALRMPETEQRERMRLMRQHVREQNVYRWAGRMLVDAAHSRQRRRILDLAERSGLSPPP